MLLIDAIDTETVPFCRRLGSLKVELEETIAMRVKIALEVDDDTQLQQCSRLADED